MSTERASFREKLAEFWRVTPTGARDLLEEAIRLHSEEMAANDAEIEWLTGALDQAQRRIDLYLVETGRQLAANKGALALASKLAYAPGLDCGLSAEEFRDIVHPLRAALSPEPSPVVEPEAHTWKCQECGGKADASHACPMRCQVFIHDWSDSYHGGSRCNKRMPCPTHGKESK